MNNLTNTARLLDCKRPTPVVNTTIPFISLFFVLVEGLLVLGFCPSLYVTLGILHVSLASRILLPFVDCSQGFRLTDIWKKPFLPFTFLNGYLQCNV